MLIAAIDKALDLAFKIQFVRWVVALSIVSFMAISIWQASSRHVLKQALDQAKQDKAAYAERLESQNAAILKAGADKQAQDAAIASATKKADKYKQEAEEWRRNALRDPLTGSCDEMVDQVIGALQ